MGVTKRKTVHKPQKNELKIAVFGFFLFALCLLPVSMARADTEGPLILNRQTIPGVTVRHTPYGQTLSRTQLEKALGPLGSLLPDTGDVLGVAELVRALSASVGAAPADMGRAEPGPAVLDRALAAAAAELDAMDAPALDRGLSQALARLEDEPVNEVFPAGALTLWVRPRAITDLRTSKEGDAVRLVIQTTGEAPPPVLLNSVKPHFFTLLCLFCTQPRPLATPLAAGLVSLTITPHAFGQMISFVLRPEAPPRLSRLSGPPRLLLAWPWAYHTVESQKPHACLSVDTVMDGDDKGPLTYFHAVYNASCPDFRLRVVPSSDRLGRPRDPEEIARHAQALLLVNGGYFDGQGYPIGVWRQRGVLLSTGSLGRSAVVLNDGLNDSHLRFDRPKAAISLRYRCAEEPGELSLSRVNQPPRPDGYSLYTQVTHKGFTPTDHIFAFENHPSALPPFLVSGDESGWGPELCPQNTALPAEDPPEDAEETGNGASPPLPETGEEGADFESETAEEAGEEPEPGETENTETVSASPPALIHPLPVSYSVTYYPDDLQNAPDLLEAGPRLVRGGVARTEAAYENFQTATGHFGPGRAPRTAVGYNPQADQIHFLVISGRHDESRGATLQETADLLLSLGATEALNLDGGGSSALVIEGKNVSFSPLLGARHFRRPVPNALALVPAGFEPPPWDDARELNPYLDIDVPLLPDLSPPTDPLEKAPPLPDPFEGLKPVEDPQWKGP